jgi:hypothetical protein
VRRSSIDRRRAFRSLLDDQLRRATGAVSPWSAKDKKNRPRNFRHLAPYLFRQIATGCLKWASWDLRSEPKRLLAQP